MDQPIFKNLEVDEISGNYFKTASRWSIFISIVYIVCMLLIGIVLLANNDNLTYTYSRVMSTQQLNIALGALVAILIIAVVIILIITFFFLMSAIQIKKGVIQHDQRVFNSGLGHLKNGLMIYGILALLGIAFNLVSLFL